MDALLCLPFKAPRTAWWILRLACIGSAAGASGHAQTTTHPGLPSYTFVDLGASIGQSVPTLAGKDTAARGLNDSRAVVGDDGLYAMYGAAQGMVAWRHADGAGAPVITNGTAFAISNAGVIVGGQWLNATTTQAVRVVNGVLEPIVSVAARSAIALGISNTGYVIGELANETTFTTQAFRWFEGTTTLIGAANGYTQAYGVNDAGDVVGSTIQPWANDGTAFLWRNGAFTFLSTTASAARDINNNGMIVGAQQSGSGSAAFKHVSGTRTPLGTVLGFSRHTALAVNGSGVIVGEASNDNRSNIRMEKVHQKISGCFRPMHGLGYPASCAVIISTCQKHGLSAMQALRTLFSGRLPNVIPKLE